jgi:diguanylate cyclase
VSEHRRGERQYVVKAMRDLRETIWAFVACAHQIAKTEEQSGSAAAAQLERVKAAVESNETAAIRREAIAAVEVVGELLERRKAEQRREFARLADRLRALGRELEEARRESALDPLTQLANRKALEEILSRSVALHGLSGQPASLLMIDVDRFKATNDTYGHAVGDAALRLIADCLTRVFKRRCDVVCRYGGDEFAVLLHETGGAKAAELGARLRDAVREARLAGRGAELTLDVSVGAAELAPSDTAESWVRRADEALYSAKKQGGGRVAAAQR